MEAESPKKEKRKRDAEGIDEGHKQKKHKKEVVEDASVNGITRHESLKASEYHQEKKPKKKHKDHKNREKSEAKDTSGHTAVVVDLSEVRKEKKKHKKVEENSSPAAGKQLEPPSDEKVYKKKKHKTDKSEVQDARSSSIVGNAVDWKKGKRKDKKPKEKLNDTHDASTHTPTSKDASKEERPEEKKRKKRKKHKKQDLAKEGAPALKTPKVTSKKQTDENIKNSTVEVEQFFAPTNYVNPPPGPEPFEIVTSSLRVPIPPVGQLKPLATVCANSLSPLILRWSPEFKGVIFAYRNPKLVTGPMQSSEGEEIPLAQAVDEYAAPLIWVRADFVLFKPQKGIWLDGHVNLQNESFIGFVLWNVFTGTIERKRLPQDWIWIEDQGEHEDTYEAQNRDAMVDFEMVGRRKFTHGIGHFEDREGNRVNEGSKIKFRIWDFEPAFAETEERHFLTLEGSMLSDEEEKALEEEERKVQQRTKSSRVPVTPRRSALRTSSV